MKKLNKSIQNCGFLLLALLMLSLTSCGGEPTPTGSDELTANGSPTPGGTTASPSPGSESDPDTTADLLPWTDGMAAAQIGDVEISLQEFNFHYLTSYFWFADSGYAEWLGITDPKTLNESFYEENVSWAEYFARNTMPALTSVVAESEAARNLGLTLSAEKQAIIEETISGAAAQAQDGGMSLDEFLQSMFGQGMNESVYRICLDRVYMANMWQEQTAAAADISDAAVNEHYQNNRGDFDAADFHMFYFGTVPEEGGEDEDTDADAQQAAADAYIESQRLRAVDMEAKLTADNFTELSVEYLAEGDSPAETFVEAIPLTELGVIEGLREFISDDNRKTGDSIVLQTADGWYVIQFVDRYSPESVTIDVRHILALTESGEPMVAAEGLYNEWQDGEATEESFAALAAQKSEDTGSVNNGGLYEGVQKGEMVAPFEEWCFDPSRQTGDTGLVETEYGVHVMYFVKKNEISWKESVINTLQNKAVEAALAPLLEGLESKLFDILDVVGK